MTPSSMSRLPAQPDPESSRACGDGVQVETGEAISSDTLLRGLPSVAIDHAGTRYMLRATRAGKLILTK